MGFSRDTSLEQGFEDSVPIKKLTKNKRWTYGKQRRAKRANGND